MRNPFEELAKPKEEEFYEEVEGSFACQEPGCFSTVTEAKLFEGKQLLSWICSNDHINKIEGFHIG